MNYILAGLLCLFAAVALAQQTPTDMATDPAALEMMKARRDAEAGPKIDKRYADLFAYFRLTPEQTATLKALLKKKALAESSSLVTYSDKSLDDSKRAALAQERKLQVDEAEAQIRQFLGDANYLTYKDFKKSQPDRKTVKQFNAQLASSTTPALSVDQETRLMQAICDERMGKQYLADTRPDYTGNPGDIFANMYSEKEINRRAIAEENRDQRVLASAQQFLTPEQLAALQKYLALQRSMELSGARMAAKFVSPIEQ